MQNLFWEFGPVSERSDLQTDGDASEQDDEYSKPREATQNDKWAEKEVRVIGPLLPSFLFCSTSPHIH